MRARHARRRSRTGLILSGLVVLVALAVATLAVVVIR